MHFKQFYEMSSIKDTDVSNVRLIPGWHDNADKSYWYHFEVKGEEYRVAFFLEDILLIGKWWPVWNISFKNKESGYGLTDKMEGSATAVYSQVLLAVKKLFEIEDVKAITFSAYSEKMTSIYDRFFDKFLSKNFTRYNSKYYLEKNAFRQAVAEQNDPSVAKGIFSSMLAANRSRLKDKKDAAEKENKERELRRQFRRYVGHFVLFNYWLEGNYVAYVTKFHEGKESSFEIIKLTAQGMPYITSMRADKLLPDKKPSPEQIQKLTSAMQNSNYASYLTK